MAPLKGVGKFRPEVTASPHTVLRRLKVRWSGSPHVLVPGFRDDLHLTPAAATQLALALSAVDKSSEEGGSVVLMHHALHKDLPYMTIRRKHAAALARRLRAVAEGWMT